MCLLYKYIYKCEYFHANENVPISAHVASSALFAKANPEHRGNHDLHLDSGYWKSSGEVGGVLVYVLMSLSHLLGYGRRP